MPTLIALLRGINVGGKNTVAMSALKDLLSALGYTNPRTLLNSGNLLFDTASRQKLSTLEAKLESEILARFKVPADVILRTGPELLEALANNPFPKQAKTDPSHLVIMFFKNPLAPAAVKSLQRSIKGREILSHNARELYITYPDGIGTSKLTNTAIEKSLALRGTARNWNTILKLAALLQA
jgi:uncharacterized protein (DUF1697 family)